MGRLQFVPTPFFGELRAFRHRATGAVVALADAGVRFRRDGQYDGSGGIHDEAGAWTAAADDTDAEFVGCPITPRGRATPRQVRLPKAEWRQELQRDDSVLAIHIPPGAPMAFDACGDSICTAAEFFPKHFPDRPFRAFACGSWVLDVQFEDLLPTTSNLVRFQKEVYLFPTVGGTGEMPWQTKLRKPRSGETPAKMTTMQRAFYKHVEKGGRFHGGGCFLFPQDLKWGAQVYRSQRLPWPWVK